jgi:hypothetical protein
LSEIPSLDEKQKAEARQMNLTEEAYARSEYAARLSQQRLLQKISRFGQWLNVKLEERSAGDRIDAIGLDTLGGKLEVRALSRGETIEFEMDEDLVERFLTAGSAEAEKSIFRVLDVYLPQHRVAKAS